MRISVVSSSLDADSRSRVLAAMCRIALEDRGVTVDFIDLRQLDPPNFDDDEIYSSEVYRSCHRIVAASDGVILASPVYNWAVALSSRNSSSISALRHQTDRSKGRSLTRS